ncbi:MAG: L-serine ammonia-lyase, iron-sulfur-dependent, subunit alpha, partial [Oscillospiraceae bacterium]
MESLRELYRIGKGPSSSHAMGPELASKLFSSEFPDAVEFRVRLFGSLSKTGKGHMTDDAVTEAFLPKKVIVTFCDTVEENLPHPNTMELDALDEVGNVCGHWRVFSVGGGKIIIEGKPLATGAQVYPLTNFKSIKTHCAARNMHLWQYVEEIEGPEIFRYLRAVWTQMKASVAAGLEAEGELRGGLHVQRKAKFLYGQHHMDESSETRENRLVCAYAFAVSEENAGGGTIVTAPTCGACGVLPSVLLYMQEKRGFSDSDVVKALATAGLMGNIIKTNASISGAECGCQA